MLPELIMSITCLARLVGSEISYKYCEKIVTMEMQIANIFQSQGPLLQELVNIWMITYTSTK